MKAIMIAVFACGMAACAEQPASTSPADDNADPAVVESTPAESAEQDELAVSNPDDPSILADCVFIQFCNQPGANGTVCVVRSSAACQNQCSPSITPAIQSECEGDARAVCGGVTQPARIFCSTSHP